MWNDEVKIGEGSRLNSAWNIYGIPDGPSISENEVSYWVSNCVLRIDMTIMKDTQEGIELARLLTVSETAAVKQETVANFLHRTALRNIKPEHLLTRIKYAQEEAFRAGKAAKAAEIRSVLGV